MIRRTLPLLAAVAVLTGAPPAFAADPMPAELKYVPPDAATFVYLDVAALYDSKFGDTLKKNKSAEVLTNLNPAAKLTGLTLADTKAVMFANPSMQDQTAFLKNISLVSFRVKYDREKVVTALKATATAMKHEFSEKGNVVRVTAPSPFDQDKKTVTTHDLTDDTRIVTLVGLGDEFLKPSDATGIHSAALKANPSAAVIAGLNFNALPDEIRKEDLPPEFRPFRPILLADGLVAVGTIAGNKLEVSVTVKAKKKEDAAEVEKSLDALRTFADTMIVASKKGLKETVVKLKEVIDLLDVLQAAMKDAKFSVNGTTTAASLTLPLDANYGPVFDLFSGGGVTARAQSSNNLKQLAISMHNYHDANGFLPTPAILGKKGKKLLSWRVEVLPYIGEDALYKQFKLDEPWDSEHNMKVFKDNPMPKVYAIPGTTNQDGKKTHYQVFVGNGAAFEPAGPIKLKDFQDGTSNTILVATAATAVEWTKPDDIEFDPKGDVAKLMLFKDGVTMIGMADGSVRALSEKVTAATLKAAVTRSGGEVLGDDF